MERETTQHGWRVDDEMAKETASLTHGAPLEARVDEHRLQEDAGDDEPVPESVVAGEPIESHAPSGMSYGAVRGRSELARHLRPSIFPATRTAILECAAAEHADGDLLDDLRALPDRRYENVSEVWDALGGETEPRRDHVTNGTPRRQRFDFHFDPPYRAPARLFGITPDRAYVEVEDDGEGAMLHVRFGSWAVHTPVSNVVDVTPTGPYSLIKTAGPPHLSLRDRGLTFATSKTGICITFAHPVAGIDPLGVIRHPSLTVTVSDAGALAGALVGHE
jgi:hypothetical protein